MDATVTLTLSREETGFLTIFMDAVEQMRKTRAAGFDGRFAMNIAISAEPTEQQQPQETKAPEYTGPQLVKDEPTPEPTTPQSETVSTEPPKLEAVVEAVRDYIARKGFPAAQELLGSFGVKRVPEIPVERRAEFIGRTKES